MQTAKCGHNGHPSYMPGLSRLRAIQASSRMLTPTTLATPASFSFSPNIRCLPQNQRRAILLFQHGFLADLPWDITDFFGRTSLESPVKDLLVQTLLLIDLAIVVQAEHSSLSVFHNIEKSSILSYCVRICKGKLDVVLTAFHAGLIATGNNLQPVPVLMCFLLL